MAQAALSNRLDRPVDETLQVLDRLVGTRDAEPAQLAGQRLALSGGGQDSDFEAVRRQSARRFGAHAAAARGDDCNLFHRHG